MIVQKEKDSTKRKRQYKNKMIVQKENARRKW